MADGSQQTGLKIIIPYPLLSPNHLGPPTVPLRAWSLKHICCTLFEIQRGPTPSHVYASVSLESKTKGETFIWRLVTGCTPLLLCHFWTGSGAFRHQNNLWFTQLWIEDGKITTHLAHDWASVCICQNDWSSHDSNPWSRVIWSLFLKDKVDHKGKHLHSGGINQLLMFDILKQYTVKNINCSSCQGVVQHSFYKFEFETRSWTLDWKFGL